MKVKKKIMPILLYKLLREETGGWGKYLTTAMLAFVLFLMRQRH